MKSEKKKLLIGIPIHGDSIQLRETLESLRVSCNKLVYVPDLIITNSGPGLSKPVVWNSSVTILNLSAEKFWAGAVCSIYNYMRRTNYELLLLMNHDCAPEEPAVQALLEAQGDLPNRVVHGVLIYRDEVDRIWWAGSIIRPGRRLKYIPLYKRSELPAEPYRTSAMMGQFLLIPRSYCRNSFLRYKILPHYFADSVQTVEMNKAGAELFVVPSAIARSDQSDSNKKKARIAPMNWELLIASFTGNHSSRRLLSVLFGNYYQHRNPLSGLFVGTYMVLGTLFKAIIEYLIFLIKPRNGGPK